MAQLFSDYNQYLKYKTVIDTANYSDQSSPNSNYNKYPSWCPENDAPIDEIQINLCFQTLASMFGFQRDNVANMLDHFMIQLDSRLSRMGCPLALLSLHSDYIGGDNSNYKKWVFTSHLHTELKLSKNFNKPPHKKKNFEIPYNLLDLNDKNCWLGINYCWKQKMNDYNHQDYVYQIGLYLLIWGESNNIRFMPECICFIYQLCWDYFQFNENSFEINLNYNQFNFLNHVINPLYNFLQNQQYKLIETKFIDRERDHDKIIGYDDINLFFWYPKNLLKIQLFNNDYLYDLPKHLRFNQFANIKWDTSFFKTFKEKRSWIHILVNFNRIWIIHFTVFWFYTSYNSPTLYTPNYVQLLNNPPPNQIKWSVIALGGTLACLIATLATMCERLYITNKCNEIKNWYYRLSLLIILLLINVTPSIYIFGFLSWKSHSYHGLIIAKIQFIISLISFLYLAIVPPQFYFKLNRPMLSNHQFVSDFTHLQKKNQVISYIFWTLVFMAKFSESYFFLTLSIRDPIRVLSIMDLSRCKGDTLFGNLICEHQARLVLGLLYFINLILFFLDTYLWYVIMNVLLSVVLSCSSGSSIFSPWKNVFSKLPERIATKITFYNADSKTNPALIIALVWNGIIISMYREHLISIEQVNKLIYEQLSAIEKSPVDQKCIKPPSFFVSQEDYTFSLHDYFTPGKQAERRISFFAQSLSAKIPDPYPTLSMPTFTVLVPHYSEKILLELKELIKEDGNSKLSLLDYLKGLNKNDWDNFVKDTKLSLIEDKDICPEEITASILPKSSGKEEPSQFIQDKIDDLPYYCIGFKDASRENTLRTRIWASLRCQTLFRTISGFMNYETAIKILYKVENLDVETSSLMLIEVEDKISSFVKRKFRMLIAMQKFQTFTKQDYDNVDLLFTNYPNINIAILEEVVSESKTYYYSSLIDSPRRDENGNFIPKYRIMLSGNPILGDGKSDNQNNALIFYRGEYIQVIDANQDNYIEECLKIKSVLTEFEEMNCNHSYSYVPGTQASDERPVAILGAREYIFSEDIGILGDISAGKEKTFGTLFARTLSKIGGKLHYGHPDFLNAIFMTTRGGISKAQKGLHLNEDIFAGMLATCRGGIIKHCDYYQCGKGRDLGFGTIQNFTTKIGAGMGEQILSREYYHLGMNLPIDRFLSFYYAHLGFHLNNLLIMLAVQLFMIFLVNLGSLKFETIECLYNPLAPITDILKPIGCYDLQPVIKWVNRFVLSVFICFFISFIPLIAQEILENGILKSVGRAFSHFVSMAPFFEVFICQMYAKSLRDNITFGGAKYIASGRGFATKRISFSTLYSRYAEISIYLGATHSLALIFATLTMWQFSLLWFWITIISLCLSPFIFNPHQFEWQEFILDYRNFLRWLFRGNRSTSKSSWIQFVRANRSKFTGHKRHRANNQKTAKPNKANIFLDQIIIPMITCLLYFIPYIFINSQTGVANHIPTNLLLRALILSFGPFVLNIIILILTWCISVTIGALFSIWCKKLPTIIAAFAHSISLFGYIIMIELTFALEGWNYARSLCAFLFIISLQKVIIQIIYIFLSRELQEDSVNLAWWSGKWYGRGLGKLIISQIIREFMVKICELIQFCQDFLLSHFLLLVLSLPLLIPFIDRYHSLLIYWLKSKRLFQSPIMSKKQKKKRRLKIFKFLLVFISIILTLTSLISAPFLAKIWLSNLREIVPEFAKPLIQPNNQLNNDTGEDNAPKSILRSKPQSITMITIW